MTQGELTAIVSGYISGKTAFRFSRVVTGTGNNPKANSY
jgi:hypothetical protein